MLTNLKETPNQGTYYIEYTFQTDSRSGSNWLDISHTADNIQRLMIVKIYLPTNSDTGDGDW